MKKQLLAMFLAMGLLASGIPHTAWAKNPEDNVKTLDSAVDVQQALHANGPEAKGTKENVSDTQEQVSARVIFKNHILPEKTYGATEKFYYSAGEYYILKYQNGETMSSTTSASIEGNVRTSSTSRFSVIWCI